MSPPVAREWRAATSLSAAASALLAAGCVGPVAAPPTAPPAAEAVVHFPQVMARAAFPTADPRGTLFVADGCLRFRSSPPADTTSYLVIWASHFALARVGGEELIVDHRTYFAATPGEIVGLGGGRVPLSFFADGLREPLPEGCPGPFFLAGSMIPDRDTARVLPTHPADSLKLEVALHGSEGPEPLFRLTLMVWNPTDLPVRFTMGGRRDDPSFNFVVRDAHGREVWRRITSEDAVATPWLLSNREELWFRAEWDGRDQAGRRVPPGEYQVTGMLGMLCDRLPGPGCPVSAPVRLRMR